MQLTRRSLLGAAATKGFAQAIRPGGSTETAIRIPRVPLVPLLWTQGQSGEIIRKAVREVSASGNTGFVWESRPHPDYLGPKWWLDLGAALDEAQRLGLSVWIFDEWMYPSGVAGGQVVQNHPEFALQTVESRSISLDGPAAAGEWEMPAPLQPGERLLSAAAVGQRQDPVDITPKDGSTKVHWTKPEGASRIVWCVVRVHEPAPGWTMKNMIDVMNPAATAEFLRLTHDETFRHFEAHFGKTLQGFFSDETGFRNVTSYESLPGTPGMPMPWSPVLADTFRRWKQYDLVPWLPALWHDLGTRGRQVRFDFMDVCSRAFAEHFFEPQQDWCRRHGVRFIGHLVEDNHADHNLGYGPGHWFRSIRYFDMPGIDVVGYQVTPGVDSGSVAWQPRGGTKWDQEHFQFGLPAMARGAALLQGTREIFSEAFGAYGWSQGMRMLKWVGDWHIVNGISVLSPHAFTMKHNDPDCPAHFNRMSGNPQWRHYGEWARQFGVTQQIVAATGAEYDAAVLYTAESAWVGQAQNVGPVVRTLETNQVSSVVLPYETLQQKPDVRGGAWWVNGQTLRSVILPSVQYVPAYVAGRLLELANAGVRVIVLEAWPAASTDGRDDETVSLAVSRLKAAKNVVLTTTPEMPAHLGQRNIQLSRTEPALMAALRTGQDGGWLLLHNRSLQGEVAARVNLRESPPHAALLDVSTGQRFSVAYERAGSGLSIDVRIPAYGLWVLHLTATPSKVDRMPVYRQSEPVAAEWEVSKAVDDSGEKFERIGPRAALEDWRTWPGMGSYAGTVRYRATFNLQAVGGAIGLDAGRVEEVADLYVNGQRIGARINPPYLWDITFAMKAGANEIRIDVTNTASARWPDSFSHGDAASGLLGPVRIVRERIR